MSEEKTYPKALLGFRAWFLNQGLFSMGLGAEAWASSEKRARCKRGFDHQAPQGECSCGLHAFYDFSEVLSHRQGSILDLGLYHLDGEVGPEAEALFAGEKNALADIASYIVVGAVAARGRAELHWNGFRAQEMQVLSLLVNKEQSEDPWVLNSGLPCFRDFDDFVRDAKSRASSFPEDLRPDPPLSPIEMRELKRMYRSLKSEDDYQNLAHFFNLQVHELSDLALHLKLAPPRW